MIKRPKSVSEEDVLRWSKSIESDPIIPKFVLDSQTVREVCYAGLYLEEELIKLSCPSELIIQIQYTAGQLSFGRDPWEVCQLLIKEFKNKTLKFETEPELLN